MPSKTFLMLMTNIFFLLFIVVGCNQPTSTSTNDSIELESQDTQLDSTSASEFPPGFPTPDPEKYEECLSKGGRWQVLGFSGPGCNLPTTDAGQACKDSKECEGACFAYPDGIMKETEPGLLFPDLDAIEELNAQEEEIVGYCSEWKSNYSLLILVENGKIQAIFAD